ncbi:MAG: hypothetical protein N2449_00525 [Bacteroidales bacterium]|nr:hypothetical protein [Bacteroidales bacterium]
MRAIIFSFIITCLLLSCNYYDSEKKIIHLNQFITYDSLIFTVPETVQLNSNTHVAHFDANDSLCVINFSSGKNDPHLYIYHLKQRKLLNKIDFSKKLSIKDLIIRGNYLYVLVNNYYINRSYLYTYDLSKFSIIDSCILFEDIYNGYTSVNSLEFDNLNQNFLFFSLKTYKNPSKPFPLVGYYDLVNKKIQYLPVWYPFIKDNNNELYFYNSLFSFKNKLFIAYSSTPYLSQIDNHHLKTIKTTSIITDLHFKDNQEDVAKHNFYFDSDFFDINVITLNRKDYVIRNLTPDEKIYGSSISLISLFDENFNCVGEQIAEYFKNRESFLQKIFTKKLNDTSNISCYVFNNLLNIKIGNFSVLNMSATDYYYSLDSVRKSLEIKVNEVCGISKKELRTNDTLLICPLKKYLQQKNNSSIKENLIIVSINECPTCIKDFFTWYYSKYNLLSNSHSILILYKYSTDFEKIKDIADKYKEIYKLNYQLEKSIYLQFINHQKPFVYIKQITNCKNAKAIFFEISEMDAFKDTISNSIKQFTF